MPLYSYRCQGCDTTFETLVTSASPAACPACGGDQLERLISLPAPEGKSAGLAQRARAQATREGHLSNFGRPSRRS